MSLFELMNPLEKAKAAIAQAQQQRSEQYAKPVIDAMNQAAAAAQAAKAQEALKDATDKAMAVAKWKQQEEVMEDALEHAGISGVDVQIDDAGFARLVGSVTSELDRDTAVAMAEQFHVTGMDVQLEVVPPPPEEPAPVVAAGSGPVSYTVKAGESWWGIAQRTYGNGQLWKALKAANKNPRMIHPGTVIVLPEKSVLEQG